LKSKGKERCIHIINLHVLMHLLALVTILIQRLGHEWSPPASTPPGLLMPKVS
jgi:hypothetical protein